MLISSGANFDQDNMEVARELSIAATDNDVERLRLWLRCNVNMNMPDLEGRSPLHVVSGFAVSYESFFILIIDFL